MPSLAMSAESPNGPPVVAFYGSDNPENEFHLGTRKIDWHHHVRGQLFWIESGHAQIRTPAGSWLLPPHLAGWIPPNTIHTAAFKNVPDGWGLMLTPAASDALPVEPCVMTISELLRALVRRAATWNDRNDLSVEQQRITEVMRDEIRLANRMPPQLRFPSDRRLLHITSLLADHPEDTQSLSRLARAAGLSERTARRLFIAETGMTFMQWKQQLRLVMSLERLARGISVGDTSHALGYASPSSFIAVFRRCFGDSPGRYVGRRQNPARLVRAKVQ